MPRPQPSFLPQAGGTAFPGRVFHLLPDCLWVLTSHCMHWQQTAVGLAGVWTLGVLPRGLVCWCPMPRTTFTSAKASRAHSAHSQGREPPSFPRASSSFLHQRT